MGWSPKESPKEEKEANSSAKEAEVKASAERRQR